MDADTGRQAVILDTDIGTDVDDVVALGLLLRSPSIDLRAVTTVYVDAVLRARMVEAVLAVAGRPDVPVGRGADRPLLDRDPLYWEGHEGEGLLRDEERDGQVWPRAVDLLIETVLARPGEVTVLAVAPLTNIALALLREPRFATAVHRIVIMGGIVQRRFDQLAAPYAEHNIRCDPEAAQIVLASGAPITLVPLDVTTRVRIRRDALPRIAAADALGALVADQLGRYMARKGRDWTHPHDPLAASAAIQPDLLRTTPMRVDVETRGEFTRGQTAATVPTTTDGRPLVDVALELTGDAASFERWLVEMLARPAPGDADTDE